MPEFEDLDAVKEIVGLLSGFEQADQARIYRWVGEKLGLESSYVVSGSAPVEQELLADSLRLDPRLALRRALEQGDLRALPKLAQRMLELDNLDGFVSAATALALAGSKVGEELLVSQIENPELGEDERRHAFAALVNYYTLTDREESGVSLLERVAEKGIESADEPASKAYYLNQLGRLYFGAEAFENALRVQQEAFELNPAEPAYAYNLALILRQMGRPEEAARYIDRLIDLGISDPDHLKLAVDILVESGASRKEVRSKVDRLFELAPEEMREAIRNDRTLRNRLMHWSSR